MIFETDVPFPEPSRKPKNEYRAGQNPCDKKSNRPIPWADLGVGHSFFFLSAEYDKRGTANRAYMYGARNGKKFKVKRAEHGFRIWRIQ